MNHPPAPSAPPQNSPDLRTTPRQQLDARTHELAQIAGRPSQQVSQADYEQAKRELTGESDLVRQEAILDAVPETKGWDPVPGSPGHQAPEALNEDEDAEGRSETEQMVDDGAVAAARERTHQADQATDKAIARETGPARAKR